MLGPLSHSKLTAAVLTWHFPLHASNLVKMKYKVGFRNISPRLIYFPQAFTVRFLTTKTHVQFQHSSRGICGGEHSVLTAALLGTFFPVRIIILPAIQTPSSKQSRAIGPLRLQYQDTLFHPTPENRR